LGHRFCLWQFLTSILQAFRPGVVDMTDEQLAVPANAITLQGDGFNLDLFGDTWYGTSIS
jgi:cohesin complex subunit SCC1